MAKQRKSTKRGGTPDGTLSLRAADGTPFIAFPYTVIEHYRRMITGLLHREGLPKQISVVAALPKEGVTFTTLGLATTLASDMAMRVCAVELNWRSPGMKEQLMAASGKKKPSKQPARRPGSSASSENSATSSAGLAAVLLGKATLDEVLIRADNPNLALLPAGELTLTQGAYMARSDDLRLCIEELAGRFDYILLDIPAIQATSDAIALVSLSQACCMVVQQGITPASKVRMSLDEIKHIPMLGVVLNKFNLNMPKWLYDFIPQD